MKPLPLVGVVLAVPALWAGLTTWQIPGTVLEREVGAQILGLSGMTVTTQEAARFTLLPYPQMAVDGIRLAGAPENLSLEAATMRGKVRLLPLMGGRIELADLTLVRPVLSLAKSGFSDGALAPIGRLLAPSSEHQAPEMPDIRKLTVIDGSVSEPGPDGQTQTVMSAINGIVTRGAAPTSVDVSLALRWRDQAVEVVASGLHPSGVAGVNPSPIHASIKASLGTVELSGTLAGGGSRQTDGRLKLSTPAVERFASWLGLAMPVPLAGPLDFSGDVRLLPGSVSLANASIRNENGVFDGALTLRDGSAKEGTGKDASGRVAMSGTLATDRLDLSPLLGTLSQVKASDGAWSRDLVELGLLPTGDLDIRLSAGTVIAGSATLTNAAFTILARGGRTDIAIGNAEFLQGTVKGRVSITTNGQAGLDLKLNTTMDHVDAASVTAAMGAARRVTGPANLSVQVETTGESPMALMRAMDGKVSLSLKQGELLGINLPDLLAKIEKRPLITAFDARGGRTPFETAQLSGRISGGVFEITEGLIQSPAARVTLAGQIGLADRLYAITGQANAAPGSNGGSGIALPFEITGTLDDPVLMPDARSLIRRSGAAAPFFEPKRPTAPAGSPAMADSAPTAP